MQTYMSDVDSIKGGIVLRKLLERRGVPEPGPRPVITDDARPIFHWLGINPQATVPEHDVRGDG